MKGQYVLECQNYIDYHSSKRESMCDIHLYDARLCCKGYLADDFEFIKHVKSMSGYVDKNYQTKATTPFLPEELRDK